MNLILADENGFCYGVRDAIAKITSHIKKSEKIDLYGELIHNQESIREFKQNTEKDQIQIIHNLNDIKSSSVAIRAHGAGPSVYEFLKKNNKTIIDTTCPFVLKTQKVGKALVDEGYFVYILGKKKHPEVIAIQEHLKDSCFIIENKEDLSKSSYKGRKVAVVFQSTISISDFKEVLIEIIETYSETKIKSTICGVTLRRQKELKELLKIVDYMIILGGKNSSNTKKLFEISQELVPSIHVENEKEIDSLSFSNIKNLGLITGTSTSPGLLESLVEKIKNKDPNTQVYLHSFFKKKLKESSI